MTGAVASRPAEPPATPRGKGLRLLLVALALAGSFFYARQCVRRGNDFRLMWSAWNLVLHGEYIYSIPGPPNEENAHWRTPPFFTFVTSPLGLLPVRLSGTLWFYFKLGLIVWMVLSLKRLSDRWSPGRAGALAVPVLLSTIAFNNDLTIGHMNLVTSVLIVQGLLAYVEGRAFYSALWSSLAIVIKGNAALLPFFYLARKEFRLAALTLGFCALWTASPALVWGPSKTLAYNRDFAATADFRTIYTDLDNGWAENWGLPEIILRALGQAPKESLYGKTLEIVSLPWESAARLAKAGTALCVLLLAFWWWKSAGLADGLARGYASPLLHQAAIAATGTLLFSPVTRKAYFGTLLLPYFVLWGFLTTARSSKLRTAVAALFGTSVFCILITQVDLVGRPLASIFVRWQFLSLALLTLMSAQLLAARDAERRAGSAAG